MLTSANTAVPSRIEKDRQNYAIKIPFTGISYAYGAMRCVLYVREYRLFFDSKRF